MRKNFFAICETLFIFSLNDYLNINVVCYSQDIIIYHHYVFDSMVNTTED